MQVFIITNELGNATCIMRCDSGVERVVFLREFMLNVYTVQIISVKTYRTGKKPVKAGIQCEL